MSKFTVWCSESLGKLVLIELDKQQLLLFPEDSWFPSKVEVTSPEGDTYLFPVYRWIDDSKVHRFREGTGLFCRALWKNSMRRRREGSSVPMLMLFPTYYGAFSHKP